MFHFGVAIGPLAIGKHRLILVEDIIPIQVEESAPESVKYPDEEALVHCYLANACAIVSYSCF